MKRPAWRQPRPRRALPRLAALRQRLARRPHAVALLLAGLLTLGGGGTGLGWLAAHPGRPRLVARAAQPAPGLPAVAPGMAVALPRPGTGRRVAPPVALVIPAIGVRTRLIRLGLTPQGTLQVPASTSVAGWYTRGPRPGQVGPAIIAGHIDSYAGPAVFFRLRLLRPGDLVYVRTAGGAVAVFRVYAEHMYAKDRFPTGRVYGPTPDPELHLITCGGVFDHSTGSYLSNVVVYASELRFHRHARAAHLRHRRPRPGRSGRVMSSVLPNGSRDDPESRPLTGVPGRG